MEAEIIIFYVLTYVLHMLSPFLLYIIASGLKLDPGGRLSTLRSFFLKNICTELIQYLCNGASLTALLTVALWASLISTLQLTARQGGTWGHNEKRQALSLIAFSQTKKKWLWPPLLLGWWETWSCPLSAQHAGVRADPGPATQGRPGAAIIARLVLSTGR